MASSRSQSCVVRHLQSPDFKPMCEYGTLRRPMATTVRSAKRADGQLTREVERCALVIDTRVSVDARRRAVGRGAHDDARIERDCRLDDRVGAEHKAVEQPRVGGKTGRVEHESHVAERARRQRAAAAAAATTARRDDLPATVVGSQAIAVFPLSACATTGDVPRWCDASLLFMLCNPSIAAVSRCR